MSASNNKYSYVKIGRFYVCVDQNPLYLIWLFLVKHNALRLSVIGVRRKSVFGVVNALFGYKFLSQKIGNLLTLPVRGDLCLPVHRGYKVFNFKRNAVTKVFNSEIDAADFRSELAAVNTANRLAYAPAIIDENVHAQWYEEEYLVGTLATTLVQSTSEKFIEAFGDQLVDCLEHMILLQEPVQKPLMAHVSEVVSILQSKRLKASRLFQGSSATKVQSFVESIARELLQDGKREIYLVFSHGDFSLVNALMTKQVLKIIDWEGAARRSVLNDLYNFFFTEMYYKRATTTITSRIDETIEALSQRISARQPKLALSVLAIKDVYRKLYYLERIRMLLERDLNDKRFEVVLQSIDVFESFENAAAAK